MEDNLTVALERLFKATVELSPGKNFTKGLKFLFESYDCLRGCLHLKN